MSGIVRNLLMPKRSIRHAAPATVLVDRFLNFVGQPRFNFRLPGQTGSSRHPINTKNHPLRQIQIVRAFSWLRRTVLEVSQ